MKISKSLILTVLGVICGGAASLIRSKQTEQEISEKVDKKMNELNLIETKKEE